MINVENPDYVDAAENEYYTWNEETTSWVKETRA
jgi:hypothetical protein